MRKIILASHGGLAQGIFDSLKMIIGDDCDYISCYCLMPGESLEELTCNIKQDIDAYPNDQFIILTDLFGGSVCNSLVSLVERENIEILSGMNLCMLLTICLADSNRDIQDVIKCAINDAKKNIYNVRELWNNREELLDD